MPHSYDSLVSSAAAYNDDRLAWAHAEWQIGTYERFDFDQTTGLLTFSNAGVPMVYAPSQVVGTHSTVSETWLWAWDNSSILPALLEVALQTRAFGLRHSYSQLTTAKFPASERDSWYLAAIALYLSRSAFLYRCPVKIGSSFLAVRSLSRAS